MKSLFPPLPITDRLFPRVSSFRFFFSCPPMMPAPQLAHRTNCTNEAMDDSTDDETLSIFALKSSDTSSSEEEQEEDEEEDQEVVQPGPGVQQRGQSKADLHSRRDREIASRIPSRSDAKGRTLRPCR